MNTVVLRSLTHTREVDTTKSKLNREHLIGQLIQDQDIFGKMDPEKVRDPSTREHKMYRLAKNLNIIKEERLTEADFPQGPIASDIPNQVNNTVHKSLTPWEVFKNVPRFRYFFTSALSKVWRTWDPTTDHIMKNDNPISKSLSYQLHKNAYKIPASIGNFIAYFINEWGANYRSKVPNYPKTLVHQNGVFLFQSLEQSGYLKIRALEFQFLAGLGLLFISPFTIPTIVLLGFIAGMNVTLNAAAKYAVIRADFLPHTEQILFTKSGHFGQLYPYAVNCSDLVRAQAKNLPRKSVLKIDIMDYIVYDCYNQQMVFRDNSSGEYFAFQKVGVWSKEGLEHPFLNSLLK